MKEGAVGIITNKQGKILLQDRTHISKSGEEWGFFGGGIEFLENPQTAVIRELKEELDIDILKKEITFIGMSHWHTLPVKPFISGKKRKIRVHFFIIHQTIEEGDFTVLEGDGAKYFSLEEMKSLNKGITNFHEGIMFYEDFLSKSKLHSIESKLPN